MSFVSRKTINRFIDLSLRATAAKPLYFHQLLSFPNPDYKCPMIDATKAKGILNKFLKGVTKKYSSNDMSCIFIQERRSSDKTIHFHLCLLFFSLDKLPYALTRMHLDLKSDLFKRWKKLNAGIGKCSRKGNGIKTQEFDLKSLGYFANAVVVADKTKRAETNWFGVYNKKLIENRAPAPSRKERKAIFDKLFQKVDDNYIPPENQKSCPRAHWNNRRNEERAIVVDYFKNMPSRSNNFGIVLTSPSERKLDAKGLLDHISPPIVPPDV